MTDIRTGPDAADTMASWPTYPARECLNAVSRAFQRGDASHASEVEPLVSVGTAAAHWAAMPAQFKHAGDRNFDAIPKGAVIQCTGGEGHIFLGLGGNRAVSTDYPTVGKIGEGSITDILAHFSGNPYAGWGEWINGRAIQGLVAPTAPASSPAAAPAAWWAFNPPAADVQRRIQAALTKRGRYHGPVDGVWGVESIKGIQTTIRNVGYVGAVDGVPGVNTCHFVQVYAQRFGSYTGPIDNILGPNGWAGFALGLERP